ncbi:hypothetical protein KGM_207939 [Danaus plexippus plexippus]|uniref:Uncharacterized protein n=1 Tax=Danaus plexippus plexippus TaxID=278856 RepID=A0A212F9I2_DANPL|nr:hypothetical protein KGM_207939 [Danaus plexippus plexippus]
MTSTTSAGRPCGSRVRRAVRRGRQSGSPPPPLPRLLPRYHAHSDPYHERRISPPVASLSRRTTDTNFTCLPTTFRMTHPPLS